MFHLWILLNFWYSVISESAELTAHVTKSFRCESKVIECKNSEKVIDTCTPYSNQLTEPSLTQGIGKKNIDFSQPLIAADGTNFSDFIQNSQLWLDKSVLIRKLVESENTTFIITAPRSWGKTINLDMIRFYLEIPIDRDGNRIQLENSAAYGYFVKGEVRTENGTFELNRKPLISRYPDIQNHHLGKHPIVYLSGKGFSVIEYRASLIRLIHRTFLSHVYLIRDIYKIMESNTASAEEKRLAEVDLRLFLEYQNMNTTKLLDHDLASGILLLSRLLYSHYDEKVWILMDEFDGFVEFLYFGGIYSPSKKTIGQFYHLWKSFMVTTFNDSRAYVEKYVMTGTIPMDEAACSSGLRGVEELSALGGADAFPFYGVYENEFNDIANLCKMDNSSKNMARLWYNGYASIQHPNEPIYPTYATMNFMNCRKVALPNSGGVSFVTDLKQQISFMTKLDTMIRNDEKISIKGCVEKFTRAQIEILRDLKLGRLKYDEDDSDHANILFGFLVTIGYGSLRKSWQMGYKKDERPEGMMDVAIANTGIMNVIIRIMNINTVTQLEQQCPNYVKKLQTVTNYVRCYMKSNDEEWILELGRAIGDLLSHIAKKGFVIDNEEDVKRMLSHMFTEVLTKVAMDQPSQLYPDPEKKSSSDNRQRPDLLLFNPSRALLVEYKHANGESNITSAFQQCLGNVVLLHQDWLSFRFFEMYRFLAIRVSQNCIVELMSTTISPEKVKSLRKGLIDSKDRIAFVKEKINGDWNLDVGKTVYDPLKINLTS